MLSVAIAWGQSCVGGFLNMLCLLGEIQSVSVSFHECPQKLHLGSCSVWMIKRSLKVFLTSPGPFLPS